MAALHDECLTAEDFDRIAGGGAPTDEQAHHLASCARCRSAHAEAIENAAFLARVRTSASKVLAPDGAPRLQGYRILAHVSSGAQGAVYRAIQEATARIVAIKVLTTESGADHGSSRERRRAEREAEIAAKLRHPNVVSIFESRTLPDGGLAIVMEYVDGVPLDEWKPPGATEADRMRALLEVFQSICDGVHHAHLNVVIHRDLKPENILVTPEGRPVVLDFGVARADGLHTTRTGEFAGTPAYASPEQVSGHPDAIDALTDVYSLGVILYRLLCGAMPYELHGSLFDIARTITNDPPVPLRTRVPSIPHDLEAITLRAIRKHRADRYQSAIGMANDIKRYLRGAPVEARSGSGWYVLRKAVAMNRSRVAWVAAAAVLGITAIITVALSLAGAADADRRAEEQRDNARAIAEVMREVLPSSSSIDAGSIAATSIANSGFHRLHYRLETGAYDDEPGVDQAIRRIWGGFYSDGSESRAALLVPYAEVSLRSGLAKLRQLHGREHPDIAATLHALGSVLRARARPAEAEPICREALEMRIALLGVRTPEVAQTRLLLAEVLADAGRGADAIEQATLAAEYFRGVTDRDAAFGLAEASEIQGRVRLAEGDPVAAAPHIHDALVRRIRLVAPDDTGIQNLLTQSASLVEIKPDTAVSRAIIEAFGPMGPDLSANVAANRHIFDSFAAWPGQFNPIASRTEATHRMITLTRALIGASDLALVQPLLVLANTAENERRYAIQAEANLEAASILESHYGPNDRRLLSCLDGAGQALIFNGESDRAAEVTGRSIRVFGTIPDNARDPIMFANTRRVHAWCLAMAGRCAEAIPAYTQATDALIDILGEEHYVVALAHAGLAYCLAETGALEDADIYSTRALDLADRSPAILAEQRSHILFCRGHVLAAMGRHAEALALLDDSWDTFYQHMPWLTWHQVAITDAIAAARATADADQEAKWSARQSPLAQTDD